MAYYEKPRPVLRTLKMCGNRSADVVAETTLRVTIQSKLEHRTRDPYYLSKVTKVLCVGGPLAGERRVPTETEVFDEYVVYNQAGRSSDGLPKTVLIFKGDLQGQED